MEIYQVVVSFEIEAEEAYEAENIIENALKDVPYDFKIGTVG